MHIIPTNAEIARLRELGRRRRSRADAGRFLVEGPKLVADALASPLVVRDVIASQEWELPPALADLADQQGTPPRLTPAHVVERISTTTSPQPIVAEVELPPTGWSALDTVRARSVDSSFQPAVLVVVDLNDPGNAGTIARSAVAAGFDAVVALGECVDLFGPKAVRSSAGAIFHVPVVVDRSAHDGMSRLADLGFTRVGTRMSDATPCDQASLLGSVAVVLGSEAHGLGSALETEIDQWVAVPMAGPVESLNVAMAATILSYEVSRQRRAHTSMSET